jgi:hypothetical protein
MLRDPLLRRPAARAMLIASVVLALTGCGSGSTSPPATFPPSPTGASGPADVYLAVIASADDPNALEDRRSTIAAALPTERAMHVVLEQGACYPGIPSRYGDRYILALWDRDEAPVRADMTSASIEAEWSGRVTVTCLD